jgi:hypothetical protein
MPRKRNQRIKPDLYQPLKPGDQGYADFDVPLAHNDREYYFEFSDGKVEISSPVRVDPEHPDRMYYFDIPLPDLQKKLMRLVRRALKNVPHVVHHASGHIRIRGGGASMINLQAYHDDAPGSTDPANDNVAAPIQD